MCKESVRDLGPYKKQDFYCQCVKMPWYTINQVVCTFDNGNGIYSRSGSHKKASSLDDVKMVTEDIK